MRCVLRTTRDVRELRVIGRHCDGNGVYLVIERSGGRRWILRTVIQGRRRDMGLGSVLLVSLAEARRLARRYRKIARGGAIPLPSAARGGINGWGINHGVKCGADEG